ncbi:ABC transporter family substrate-binding protein [Streptomyces sp. WMMB 322]|uniref:ABC transporter family substrate-binding protein n=1 Tax=Streptomyces sp. WMMB 322 TaxID=1286821 RepID=UPI0006E45FD6|nr:ABC transporter family substrate-binding protein [Streptomyces sp. WMMB 322]SCK32424.1 peptide/nickel transport system substrate-binding protein [Streptomyces sp. WMMB 322]
MPAAQALDAATRRSLALLLAGVLIPLAGCTSGDGGGPSSSGGGSGAARDVPHLDREQIASGGSLRWAIDSLPRTLNAFQSTADATTERITGATLPSLFTLDSAARPQLNQDYLESAEITEREPRQTVVYKLNPKARWSSGRALGAADFKAQWKALSGKNRSFRAARNAGYDRIAKVTRGENAHEVKVVFRKPYADWKSLFAPLYPKTVMGRAEDFNQGVRASLPVSAGPFRVEKFRRGDTSITLVRNGKWWGDKAKLKRITLRVVPRKERKEALRRGQLDLAEVDVATMRSIIRAHKGGEEDAKSRKREEHARKSTAELRKQAERDGNLRHVALRHAFEPAYTQLALNGASGPLADERVRRAVARAIDRERIAKHALRGTGLPVKALGSHLRMIDQDGYADNSDALGKQDVEAAQSLLAEAGWKEGGASSSSTSDADAKKGERGKKDGDQDGKQDKDGNEKGKQDGDQDGKQDKDGEDAGNDGGKNAQQSSARERAGAAAPAAAPAVAPVSAQEAARLAGQPLVLSPATTGQRASLMMQAAHARLGTAEESGSESRIRQARAAEKEAARARAHADELRLLSDGGAKVQRMKSGKPLTLRFVLPSGPGSESIRDTGARIARELTRIGVRTQMKHVPAEDYFEKHIATGDYDLAIYSWPGTAYPATDARPIFAKPAAAADGSLLVEQNYTRVGTNQIDQLFEQASRELDDGARNDLIKRADARIWAAAASVPLYQRPQLVAAGDKVANAGAFGFETPRYQDIGFER